MTARSPSSRPSVPLDVQAEAAAWIARLHRTDRTREDDESFRRWLAKSELHASTFERMTSLWETSTRLESDVLSRRLVQRPGSPRRSRSVRWFAAAAALILAVGAFWLLPTDSVSTQVGERRNLTLDDGTRLTLNTSTRVRVLFDGRQRRVQLDEGEAFFEVAQEAQRPFIVTTSDRQITALGTSFAVRQGEDRTEIILVEGRVSVAGGQTAAQPARADAPILLSPGERLTLAPRRAPSVDRPAVERATSWRQGLLSLDKMPLREALAEMNRYSAVKLVIGQPLGAEIEVSGVFHTGDSEEFARALTRTHEVEVMRGPREIAIYPRASANPKL